jgi:hypothetical protein
VTVVFKKEGAKKSTRRQISSAKPSGFRVGAGRYTVVCVQGGKKAGKRVQVLDQKVKKVSCF